MKNEANPTLKASILTDQLNQKMDKIRMQLPKKYKIEGCLITIRPEDSRVQMSEMYKSARIKTGN